MGVLSENTYFAPDVVGRGNTIDMSLSSTWRLSLNCFSETHNWHIGHRLYLLLSFPTLAPITLGILQ